MSHPLSFYLRPDLVLFSNASSARGILQQLVHQGHLKGVIPDAKHFYQAIIEREKIVSTAVGMGVAIPHAKQSQLSCFFVMIGILQHSIDWKTGEEEPFTIVTSEKNSEKTFQDHLGVSLVFLIGGPDDRQTEYLQLLSNLTRAIREEKTQKKLLTTTSPQAVIDLFKDFQ